MSTSSRSLSFRTTRPPCNESRYAEFQIAGKCHSGTWRFAARKYEYDHHASTQRPQQSSLGRRESPHQEFPKSVLYQQVKDAPNNIPARWNVVEDVLSCGAGGTPEELSIIDHRFEKSLSQNYYDFIEVSPSFKMRSLAEVWRMRKRRVMLSY
ncbi:hypothetical protein AVEN_50254-1 [Araneus ventricosus]|uniref:Uncharacterized protein n=1 Tax=Araneus ventricosus TaxID=182803 RepID=A0A4Y2E4N9_ARAVE|nr:hypothetical protein AVEN_50254-1 [Araneus ventricosus]